MRLEAFALGALQMSYYYYYCYLCVAQSKKPQEKNKNSSLQTTIMNFPPLIDS